MGGSFANGFKDNGKTAGIGFNFAKGYQDRAWVDQPSVFSGTGKVTINVGGNTHLKGASVFSKNGDLTLNSGTLTYDDIRNYDRSKTIGFSINLSHSFGGRKDKDEAQKTKDTIAQIGDVFKASGFGVDGSYEETDKQGITRATIGASDINIRDKEKQAELESSGKTQKVANINRDLDKAQEVTKDERKAFGVYATDTSVKHAIKAVEVTGEIIEEFARTAAEKIDDLLSGTKEAQNGYEKSVVRLKDKSGLSNEQIKEANKLLETEEGRKQVEDYLETEEGQRQVANIANGGSCNSGGGQQGFRWSPWHLLVAPAYAAEPVSVCLLVAGGVLLVAAVYAGCKETRCDKAIAKAMNRGLENAKDNINNWTNFTPRGGVDSFPGGDGRVFNQSGEGKGDSEGAGDDKKKKSASKSVTYVPPGGPDGDGNWEPDEREPTENQAAKFDKQYKTSGSKSLKKSHKSLEKRISKHQRKVKDNPNSNSVNHWKKEIRNFRQEQNAIRQVLEQNGETL